MDQEYTVERAPLPGPARCLSLVVGTELAVSVGHRQTYEDSVTTLGQKRPCRQL